ncbi:low molecular weight protein-tyrosine-phosphatase [Prosthecobacter sp. SYSU 5D2]|uniref:low molecular weight protein-tyrosine-phosphatase n=1 Tax=Prosthecobacter sp. SYSU 5D2 TaxID=3134134 RepID=UPI0031FE5AE5
MSPAPVFKLLFVCLGNICRSPAAEGVMRRVITEAGLAEQVFIDSAGTAGWHTGKRADQRMMNAATARGFELTSFARQVQDADLGEYDLILVMDRSNQQDLRAFDRESLHAAKVRLFCEFCSLHEESEVPDPYYGGPEGFDKVLDLLEDGCAGILKHIRQHLGIAA